MATLFHMEEKAISWFKVACLAVMERVRRMRKPVLVTRPGVTIAEIVLPSPLAPPEWWLGCMAGTAEITGNIVTPGGDADDWEANR